MIGKYKVRLYTQNPDTLKSYSNTIEYLVPARNITFGNVITPNNDGKNDTWKFDNLKFNLKTKVTIFNRWGVQVYSSDDYQGDWGTDAEAGTYYYTVENDGKNPLKVQGVLQVLK